MTPTVPAAPGTEPWRRPIAPPGAAALPSSASPWIIPAVILAVLVLGTVLASAMGSAEVFNNRTGVVQPGSPSQAPILNQISTSTVELLVPPPFAALVGAAIAYLGVRKGLSHRLALVGTVAGTATFSVLSATADVIGQWWLADLPTDTNLTAGIWAAILVPAGTLSLLFALLPVPSFSRAKTGASFVSLLLFGAIFGMMIGAYVGSVSSTVTWAASCPQTGANCFPVGGVVGSGSFVGGSIGAGLGAVCGIVAWLLRPKAIVEPAERSPHPAWT